MSIGVTFNEQSCGTPQLTIMCKLVTKLCTESGGVIDVQCRLISPCMFSLKYISVYMYIYIVRISRKARQMEIVCCVRVARLHILGVCKNPRCGLSTGSLPTLQTENLKKGRTIKTHQKIKSRKRRKKYYRVSN